MTTNPDDKKPKQVLATYAVIALIVMFLLNIFVLPGIMERSIRETTYSDFLKGIDSKQIQEVQFDVQDSIIYYTIEQDGKTQGADPRNEELRGQFADLCTGKHHATTTPVKNV